MFAAYRGKGNAIVLVRNVGDARRSPVRARGQPDRTKIEDVVRILLVEDEPRAAQVLAKGLREQAYAVDIARDGERAMYAAAVTAFDAVILDVGLPRLDGFAVCRRLREDGSDVPVLMLTARDAVEARIQGLDSGADDYLTKPFDFGELLARLRALIRRGRRPLTPSRLRVGPLELDTRARRAHRDGLVLHLTAREYALLEHLVFHTNEVVGRAELTEHVWEAAHEPLSNTIDVCIQRLRRKIDVPGRPSLIVTRRSEGYMLSVDGES
jgi:two-component system copper resistance phosphate regulon response regulator CusR